MRNMENASSTQIMVYNLVWGLHKKYKDIIFLPIVGSEKENQSLIETFRPITNKTILMPTGTNIMANGNRPLYGMIMGALCFFRNAWYMKYVKKMLSEYDSFDVIVSHSPSVEPVFYAKAARKLFPNARYVQFWSDPYARSNLAMHLPLPFKRRLMAKIENAVLRYPDEIIYGTDTLYQAQSLQFPKRRNKMRPCDVSYNMFNASGEKKITFSGNGKVCGYVGNYFKEIRNIEPCYQAFAEHPELGNLVLCGSGNASVIPQDNIALVSRCSPAEATAIENGLDVLICVLNVKTAQIPGKVFYQTNSGKPIVVILDGPDWKEIYQYLKKFDRFEFCENNPESISECIKRIQQGEYSAKLDTPEMLAPEMFAASVIEKTV